MSEVTLCGTCHSDGFMTFEHKFIAPGNSMASVFICYSRRGARDFAWELREALVRHGHKVFTHEHLIPTPVYWGYQIADSIEAADAFVFVITPDSVYRKSPSRAELDHAVEHNKRVIPIVRDDVDEEWVPPPLESHHLIFFREHDDFDRALQSLLEAINAVSD